MKRAVVICLAVMLLPVVGFCVKSVMKQPKDITVLKDLYYTETSAKDQSLDLYLPKEEPAKSLPVVVIMHGGGWYMGDKADFADIAYTLVYEGYAVASINYTFIDKKVYPACLMDCISAVRWVKANADTYRLDKERIGVFGDSSGGHLALMTAYNGGAEARVKTAVVWYPVTDIPMYYLHNPKLNTRLMGGKLEDMPEAYKKASPTNYVSKDDPPTLIVHGEKDAVVSIAESELLLDLAKKAGAELTLLRVKNAPHGFDAASNAKDIDPSYHEIMQATIKYFDKYLK